MRVLLIEDDALVATSLLDFLSIEDFEVKVAENIAAAESILPSFTPDVVVSDCVYGAGEFVKNLKQARPKLPVIIVSGDPYSARDTVPDADRVLNKGAGPAPLIATIRELAGGQYRSR